ncbi:hypothetical protein B7993_08955 [Fibrobacter sp. UWH3]|nr:hypothetical protein B7993_08955 [Fibrobacter sp. UWH3]
MFGPLQKMNNQDRFPKKSSNFHNWGKCTPEILSSIYKTMKAVQKKFAFVFFVTKRKTPFK